MAVENVHRRRFAAPAARLGELLDALGTDEDRLWPGAGWPPIRLDGPPVPGTAAGHGPVRYHVVEAVPGTKIRFRFDAPSGVTGHHGFTVLDHGEDGCELVHVLDARLSGQGLLSWPLMFRPMHDVVLEQLLDNAERALTGVVGRPAVVPPYVRLLRAGAGLLPRQKPHARR